MISDSEEGGGEEAELPFLGQLHTQIVGIRYYTVRAGDALRCAVRQYAQPSAARTALQYTAALVPAQPLL